MNQFTLTYLIFVITIYLLFVFVPSKVRPILLLIASLGYYVYIEQNYYSILLTLIVGTYFTGLAIESGDKRARKLYLQIYIILIILMYLPFKYHSTLNFFAIHVFKYKLKSYLLPLGLSFFTFQSLSYVFDVYYKKTSAERSFLKCALYISFFPQLICGPIERYQKMVPQIELKYLRNRKNITRFCLMLYSGLFKKFILADNILPFAIAYSRPEKLSGSEWVGISILTRYHIFLDFSGYTDIAIALGILFGYEFTNNFNRPFAASTIDEFWRRWHITLSTWIRDYIFYPLVSNAKTSFTMYIALITSFVFLGLWHGDNVNFLIYGLVNGCAIVATLIVRKYIKKNNSISFLRKFAWPFTFIFFVSLPTVLMRSENFSQSLLIFKQIFNFKKSFWQYSDISKFLVSQISIYVFLILICELLSYINTKKPIATWLEMKSISTNFVIGFLLIVVFYFFYTEQILSIPYIYENF